MSDAVHQDLQRALVLTIEMVEAAMHDNWTLVSELDGQRHRHLQHAHGAFGAEHYETLQLLHAHNGTLLERVEQVRSAAEQQLNQHQYNHRALQTYMTSAR